MRTVIYHALVLLSLTFSQLAVAQEPPMVNLTNSPSSDDRQPTWSPDGTQIAFQRGDDIWLIPATGGQAVPLMESGRGTSAPDWSPDGDLIAFHTRIGLGSFYEIWVVTVPGGDLEQISCCASYNFDPSWSPDGSQIVFTSDRPNGDGIHHLFVMAATGEPPAAAQLTFADHQDTHPDWSPDGTQIVFASWTDVQNSDLWVMPATGGPATQLTDYPGHELAPAWSPDGTQIAFFGYDGMDIDDIFVVPATGGQATRLTTHWQLDEDPVWSPDGTKIAFSSRRTGNDEIWVMDLSTTAVELAPAAPVHPRLLASPNPFRDATTIRLAGMEGGEMLRILDVSGRFVREIGVPVVSVGGTRSFVWDGRDASGLPVAQGIYFMTIESGSRRVSGSVVRAR